jgi:type II secretory pathway component PulF
MFDTALMRIVAAFAAAWKALSSGDSVTMPDGRKIGSRDELGIARQTQTVITGLVIVITASLAVIVVDQFDQSLGTPQSSELSTAQNEVLSGFGDMVSLIGPLLLVLIAVVIVGVVQRLRG